MNYGLSLSRAFCTIGLMLTLRMSMNACGIGSEKWKEEVRLSDGRVIVVDRELIREEGGDEWASNRSGSKPKEYRIRLVDPDGFGKTIEWRSQKKSPRTWPEVPLVFDIASGKPTVFSLVAISAGCEVYSKYVYLGDKWTDSSLKGQAVNLVRRLDGKSIRGRNGNVLMEAADGRVFVGVGRRLRISGPSGEPGGQVPAGVHCIGPSVPVVPDLRRSGK